MIAENAGKRWRRSYRGHHVLHKHKQPERNGGGWAVAKKAVEKGLTVPKYVKTSLAPGSRVVTDYFNKAGVDGVSG